MKTIIRVITVFLVQVLTQATKLKNFIRVIESSNIGYYSYNMKSFINDLHIETYDVVMFIVFSVYLVAAVWYPITFNDKKRKTAHTVLKVIFHLTVLGIVFYEAYSHLNGHAMSELDATAKIIERNKVYGKVIFNITIYFIVEVVVWLWHYRTHKTETLKEKT